MNIDTAQMILFYGTEVFLLGTAELFVIITGGIDLSVGFVMGFATVIASKLMVLFINLGFSPLGSVAAASVLTLLIGLLPGLVNGWLVAQLKVPAFIATFSMLGVTRGVSELLLDGSPAKNLPSLAGNIGNGFVLFITKAGKISFFSRPEVPRGEYVWALFPLIVILSFVFIAIFAFILKRTRFGMHVYAIGGNKEAAERAGINVRKDLIKVYMISSFFASLAGLAYTFKYITGKADAGSGMLLNGIAAVVIGGAAMSGGSGSVWRTILGCMIVAILETGLRIMNLQTFTTYIVVGVILIMAVIVDQLFPNIKGSEA
ncbi:ribose ABC transporter permease [Treponema sp.]